MIERVKENEAKLDTITFVLNNVKASLDALKLLKNDIKEINKYYGSDFWYNDVESFDNKRIANLIAGVLSEDAIWNMDESLKDLVAQMDELKEIIVDSIKGE